MPTARRSLVLVLAYLASALVATLVVALPFGWRESGLALGDVWISGFIIFALGAPVAWLPLALALTLTLRLSVAGLLACLCSSVFAAVALVVWEVSLIHYTLRIDASPSDPPIWQSFLEGLPVALVAGVAAGLVFWAIAFRRSLPAR